MAIQKLYVKEIGPFKEATLEFLACRDPDRADIHIFTGPNGSGKSTLLYAMAACLGGEGRNVAQRMWNKNTFVAIHANDFETAFSCSSEKRRPFGTNLQLARSTNSRYFLSSSGNSKRYFQGFQRELADVSFAAFAYSGARSVESYKLRGIQEIDVGPLVNNLSFNQTANSGHFVQWVANSHAKEALALKDSDDQIAEGYARTRRLIEDSLSMVLGKSISLILTRDPLNVLAKRNGTAIALDLLPDGLKSTLSWLGDLLMRMDRIPWENSLPIHEREFVLLLDEIEIHLHPAWQWKILPMIQKLFPKAQVFVSTHSPFVVASVDDAWIHPLELDADGYSHPKAAEPSKAGESYTSALRDVLGVSQEFDSHTQDSLKDFEAEKNKVLASRRMTPELNVLAEKVMARGEEPGQIVQAELRQIKRILEKKP